MLYEVITVDIGRFGGMGSVAIRSNMTGKTGALRRHGISTEGIDTTGRLAEFLTLGIGQFRRGPLPFGMQTVHHFRCFLGMTTDTRRRAIIAGDVIMRRNRAVNQWHVLV